jgi:hypothetical protein
MKQLLLIAATLILFTSCKSSKDYLSRGDEDKTLFDIVKKLSKRSDDEDAVKALPEVYNRVQQNHLKKIAVYKSNTDIRHWDKLVDEYYTLQSMYNAISTAPAANRLINAVSYQNELDDTKYLAAAAYYNEADVLLTDGGRTNARASYNFFKKADNYIPGYKDAAAKMEAAYQSAIVAVVISPILDNSFFLNTNWGSNSYNYSNDYFQQTLVRDMGGVYASRYPAKFYTERDASREHIQPDWVVELKIRDMDIPQPKISTENRNVSADVEAGRDTSGRTKYQTAYATIITTTKKYTAFCQMDMTIMDIKARKNISYHTYNEDYSWQEISYSYTGDNRAFSSSEFEKIKNSNIDNKQPRKEDILKELYRKIYPKVKSDITFQVNW